MLNEHEIEQLRMFTLKELKEESDKFDFIHEIDRNLTYFENKNILFDKFDLFRKKELSKKEELNQIMEIEQLKSIGEKIGLKEIFGNARIIALAANKNTGKTNNLISLISEFRKTNMDTPIYVYGFPAILSNPLKELNVQVINSIAQLVNKRDCILIIEEMQKLRINDKRYKEERDEFVDFIYHNNVYCILSSPNLREFNSVIGSVIERWLVKSIDKDQCVNGSQLKEAVMNYRGWYKKLGCISLPNDKILLLNNESEVIINCEYIEWADTKKSIKDLFGQKIVNEKVKEVQNGKFL